MGRRNHLGLPGEVASRVLWESVCCVILAERGVVQLRLSNCAVSCLACRPSPSAGTRHRYCDPTDLRSCHPYLRGRRCRKIGWCWATPVRVGVDAGAVLRETPSDAVFLSVWAATVKRAHRCEAACLGSSAMGTLEPQTLQEKQPTPALCRAAPRVSVRRGTGQNRPKWCLAKRVQDAHNFFLLQIHLRSLSFTWPGTALVSGWVGQQVFTLVDRKDASHR